MAACCDWEHDNTRASDGSMRLSWEESRRQWRYVRNNGDGIIMFPSNALYPTYSRGSTNCAVSRMCRPARKDGRSRASPVAYMYHALARETHPGADQHPILYHTGKCRRGSQGTVQYIVL
jgi:hypothetical protein